MARDALVLPLAHEQHGLVSRSQALKAGMSEHAIDGRVKRGDWEPVASGVYRLPGAVETWHQRAMAPCLQGAPFTVLSHRSAAYVWRLDAMTRRAPEPIEVTVDRGHKLTTPVEVHFPRSFERGKYRGFPVTPLSRTLIDLAPVLPELELEMAFDSAMRFGPRALKAVQQKLKALPARGRAGIGVLRDLVEAYDGTRDSALEVLVHKLLWAAGLPKPKLHFNVWHARRWIANVDFAWPEQKLVVQAYGLTHHLNRRRYRIDQRQEMEMQAAGWLPMPATWDDVTNRPASFIKCMRAAWARMSGVELPAVVP